MKLKALELDSEEFWDYVFSLPKDVKEEILSEIPKDWTSSNVYVEKELLENKHGKQR